VPIVLKCGSLNLLEPSGSVKACNENALPLPLPLPVFGGLHYGKDCVMLGEMHRLGESVKLMLGVLRAIQREI
jgi:hypothetical protein